MTELNIASLSLVLSDGDRADLERLRQRIAEWAGAESGPAQNVIVYAAFLRMVRHVDALARGGCTHARSTFARDFYDVDDDAAEPFPSDPDDRWCQGCGQWLYLGCECGNDDANEKDV